MVVNKSTVPIGSGNWVESLIRTSYEQHHGGGPTTVCGRLNGFRGRVSAGGQSVPDRIVVGGNAAPLEIIHALGR